MWAAVVIDEAVELDDEIRMRQVVHQNLNSIHFSHIATSSVRISESIVRDVLN